MGLKAEWDPADRQRVLDLWTEGKTAREIAMLMPGRSRNSVLGIVHRAAGSPKRTVTTHRLEASRQVPKPRAKPPVPIFDLETELAPADPPIFMVDLESHHCRWPYDVEGGKTFQFCGRQHKKDSPYCEVHAAKAMTVSKPYVRAMSK